MMNNIFHIHIAKSGGSSLNYAIGNSGKYNIFPYYMASDFLTNKDKMVDYDMFHGHVSYSFVNYITKPIKCFTMLRNPCDRALSYYKHITRSPEHYDHENSKTMSMAELYMSDENTFGLHCSNYATLVLSGADVGTSLIGDKIKCTDDLYDMAKNNLTHHIEYGIFEYYDTSFYNIMKFLNLKNVIIEKSNASSENDKRKLTLRENELIKEHNHYDMKLYSWALKQFTTDQ